MPPVAFAFNESHRAHRAARHVERPERLETILAHLDSSPVRRHLRPVDFERAPFDVLHLVHDPDHVRHVVDAVERGFDRLDPDTYITRGSLRAAMDGIGALLAVTRRVLDGKARTGFAAIRPPGHHATIDRSMGFCLFSNVAVAARWAQREADVRRVLIVDFDVHHGNGTQDVFYEDPDVLYVSLHQSPLYPGTGAVADRGAGAGRGTTINVPLPAGTGDDAYGRVFRDILHPHVADFRPEIIFVSAGYDAHRLDPLGGMNLSVQGFAGMVREITDWAATWCDGRLVAALEGGYHAEALAQSVLATLEVLHDSEAVVRDPLGPADTAADLDDYLDQVSAALKKA